MKTLNKKSSGFTLVEIMIVVAIIALLASIAVPSFLRARQRSQATSVLNNLRLLDAAKDQYAIESNLGSAATPSGAQLATYLKPGSSLAIAAAAASGGTVTDNKFSGVTYALNSVGALPSVAGAAAFGSAVDASFWSPFTAAQ